MEQELYTKVNKQAVLALSGGLDSTSLLLNLLHKEFKINALTFDYGQKHSIEIERAKANIKYLNSNGYNISHKIINISECVDLLTSSLTDKNIPIPEGYYEEENMISTVVPNRNAIFSSILFAYALSIQKKHSTSVSLALAVHAGDHEIYPDCREEFYIKIMEAFKIGNWNSNEINLYLPYIKLDKKDILKNAIEIINILKLDFKLIFKNTISSYNPDKHGRSHGKTGSDIERILAFDKNNLKDPLEYVDKWENVLLYAKKIEKRFKEKV